VWSVAAAAGVLAWRVGDGSVPVVALAVLTTLVAVTAAYAVLLGLTGVTPGRGLVGLRVVDADDGSPVGVARAAARLGVVGLLTLPTLGLGAATLAATAALDPGGRRRGAHDRLSGSVVLDARPVAAPAPVVEAPAPVGMVNLTALRLAPVPEPQAPGPSVPVGARLPRGPRPSAPPGPDASPVPRWRVTFDSGETLLVEGLALVGRGPQARPGEDVHHVVPLRSTDMSLSKTHAQVHVAPDGSLVVMDRGSTNGSTVVRGGVSRSLGAGRPTTLLDEDTVRFGDRTMTVEQA